jgi:hypothetical protein
VNITLPFFSTRYGTIRAVITTISRDQPRHCIRSPGPTSISKTRLFLNDSTESISQLLPLYFNDIQPLQMMNNRIDTFLYFHFVAYFTYYCYSPRLYLPLAHAGVIVLAITTVVGALILQNDFHQCSSTVLH